MTLKTKMHINIETDKNHLRQLASFLPKRLVFGLALATKMDS